MNEAGSFRDLIKRQIGAADNVEDDAGRALDGRLQKRRVDGETDGVDDAVLALRDADAHVRKSPVLERSAYIRKVEVDERGRDDEIGDAADALLEHFIRNAECIRHRGVLGNDLADLLVRNDDDGIDILLQIVDALDRIVHPALALKFKGLGHDGNRQDFFILCDLCNDGSGARSRSAAHSGGNEQKIRPLDVFCKLFLALLGSLSADLGFRARAQSLRALRADLDLLLRLVARKDLCVGIDGNIVGTRDPRLDHAVHGIVAGSAHTDDGDLCSAVGDKIVRCGCCGRTLRAVFSSHKGNIVVEHSQPPNMLKSL